MCSSSSSSSSDSSDSSDKSSNESDSNSQNKQFSNINNISEAESKEEEDSQISETYKTRFRNISMKKISQIEKFINKSKVFSKMSFVNSEKNERQSKITNNSFEGFDLDYFSLRRNRK